MEMVMIPTVMMMMILLLAVVMRMIQVLNLKITLLVFTVAMMMAAR